MALAMTHFFWLDTQDVQQRNSLLKKKMPNLTEDRQLKN